MLFAIDFIPRHPVFSIQTLAPYAFHKTLGLAGTLWETVMNLHIDEPIRPTNSFSKFHVGQRQVRFCTFFFEINLFLLSFWISFRGKWEVRRGKW